MRGIVKWFDVKKGFGFITNGEGNDVFVHYSNINGDGFKTLHENDKVSFDIETDEAGKSKAVNVTIVQD